LTIVIIVGALMYEVEGEANGFTSIPTGHVLGNRNRHHSRLRRHLSQTVIGHILASLLMTVGYGIIAVPTGIVSF
jgi:voltage-gated potassium channel